RGLPAPDPFETLLRAPRPQGGTEFLERGQRLAERRSGGLLLLGTTFDRSLHEERAREIERLRHECVFLHRVLEGRDGTFGVTPIGLQHLATPHRRPRRPW